MEYGVRIVMRTSSQALTGVSYSGAGYTATIETSDSVCEKAMEGMLRLTLFGGARITRSDVPLQGFYSTKAQALLCYLAVTGRPHARASLANLLWSDLPEARALHSLRQVLHNLRRLLPEYLQISRNEVAFDTTQPFWLDTALFQSTLQRAAVAAPRERVPLLRAGVALYAGAFLQGFRVDQAPAFDEWQLLVGESLHAQVLQMLGALVAELEAQGDLTTGIAYARHLLDLEPWHEAGQRQLMQLLARSGQRSAALSQFEEYRRLLFAELSVAPDAETMTLAEQIRGGAFDAAIPATAQRHNLPEPPTPTLGRDSEAERARTLLKQPTCRLLTLCGPGGVGKSRLALEIGRSLVNSYPDGVFLVELASVGDPELVPATIAQIVGAPRSGNAPLIYQLHDYLRDKQLLLILDNWEQLMAATPILATLLAHCPRLQLVVTSRTVLHLRGEHIFQVPPLSLPDLPGTIVGAGPAWPEPALLRQLPSVELFCQCAQAVNPAFALTPANLPVIAQICVRLDGLPLAIELAAAWSRLLSPEALLDRLVNRLQLLDQGMQDMPQRHRTLRDVLAWGYNLLDGREQAAFGRLGVFVGGCTLQAAETVCGMDGAPLAAILGLLDKSLLYQRVWALGADEAEVDARLLMLETIREYALEQLESGGEAEILRRRHAEYFADLAEAAEPELMGARQSLWLDRLEIEHDNLRAALRWARDRGQSRLALRLGAALWRFWYTRGHLGEGRQWLGSIMDLNAGAECDGDLRARILHGAGVLAHYQGENAEARLLLERALALCRIQGDMRQVAAVLHDLAGVVQNQHDGTVRSPQDHAQATALFEESLALSRQTGYVAGTALSLYRLGTLAYAQGDDEHARGLCEESLRLFRRLEDKGSMAAALNSLGYLAWRRGDFAMAVLRLEEGLALYREVRNQQGVAWTLSNLARVAEEQHDEPHALALYEERQALLRALGHRPSIASGLRKLGQLAGASGDMLRARSLLHESVALCQALEDQLGCVECVEQLAELVSRQPQGATDAVALWALADAMRLAHDLPLSSTQREQREHDLAAARAALDASIFATTWSGGQAMTLEQLFAQTA